MKMLFLAVGMFAAVSLSAEVVWGSAQTISDVEQIDQVEVGVSCLEAKKGIAVWIISGLMVEPTVKAATFNGAWQTPIIISE